MEASIEREKRLYTINWLLVRQFPDHTVRIPEQDFIKLEKTACFTTWDETESGDYVIRAYEGKK